MKAVVFSKKACGFCIRVKHVLDKNGVEFDERMYGDELTKDDIQEQIGTDFRTFPQVLINGEYVGGYQEVCKYFNVKTQ